jgi:hypothetical protein
MPASPAPPPADRVGGRQLTLWLTFTAVLIGGLVLFFRFGDRVLPFLDAALDR